MANTVVITTVNEGPRNLVLHVYLASDGASGDIVDEVLIDPVSLGLPATTRLAIETISYNFAGFNARVEFDSGVVEDNMIWVLSEHNSEADFMSIGGLFDRSGIDGTGRVQLTTTGLGSVGDEGSIVISMRTTGKLTT